MKRNRIVRFPLLMMLLAAIAVAGFVHLRPTVEATEAERNAIFALREYGALIGQGEGGEAVFVDCSRSDVTDDILIHLRNLPHVDRLALTNMPISDSGLVHVVYLKTLTSINLAGTRVTDAGLQHLSGLTRLEVIALNRTTVSDAGLNNFHAMNHLYLLHVPGTRVTDEGAAKLRTRMPRLKITRRRLRQNKIRL